VLLEGTVIDSAEEGLVDKLSPLLQSGSAECYQCQSFDGVSMVLKRGPSVPPHVLEFGAGISSSQTESGPECLVDLPNILSNGVAFSWSSQT